MQVSATAHNKASEVALDIYSKVLDAVRADTLIYQALQRAGDALFVQGRHIDLSHYDRVWIAGSGKASVAMAKATSDVLGDRLTGGLIVTKAGSAEPIPRITVLEASHPIPDATSLEAGVRMLQFAESLNEKDLVLFLLSGGSSALLESPRDGISLDDLQQTNKALLDSGADIRAINTIRSKLSRIKAGGLAKAFEPATVFALVLSDVIGNDLQSIGSGPLITPRISMRAPLLLEWGSFPAAVQLALTKASENHQAEFPVEHFVIGSISLAIHAAADAARSHRLRALPFGDPIKGEARAMAKKICINAKEHDIPESCMIFGGETTVTIRGNGLGGRCMEMALASVEPLSKMSDVCFLAAGTDGSDGPTEAAGAIVDPGSLTRGKKAGFSSRLALSDNASYSYLKACEGLIITGPTGSNVNDIVLLVRTRD